MAGYQMNEAEATKASQGFSTSAESATTVLRTMLTQVDELKARYMGAQADALMLVIEDIKGRINKLIGQVNELSGFVAQTARDYGATDVEAAQSFKAAGAVYDRLTTA